MHPAMVPVFDQETGATLLRFPVDARELCATGAFSLTPPVVVAAVEEPPVEEAAPAPKRRR
jgi:hypothetical protein